MAPPNGSVVLGSGETLTIVFTDAEGSTVLRSTQGDRKADEILGSLLEMSSRLVDEHGGHAVKATGDGLLAVFSSARRAVEFAVALQKAARGQALRLRIGLSSGEVTTAEDGDISGVSVNAAARVMTKAGGGQILASDVVRQLTGGAGFEFVDRGRFRLKGLPDRWRLHEVVWRPDPPAHAGTDRTLVGRDREITRLTEAIDKVAAGQGLAVLVAGEPGIGKTRLGHEAMALAAAAGFRTAAAQASPLGAGLGYSVVIQALTPLLASLDQAEREAPDPHLARLAGLLPDMVVPPAAGTGDAGVDKTLLFDAATRVVCRMASRSPVALLLDDIQWADESSLELIHYLARNIAGQRILLVLTFRPIGAEADERLRPLLNSLRRVRLLEEIRLSRLGSEDTRSIAGNILGAPPPPRLAEALARTGGTPLFIESLVRSLLDSGRLVAEDGQWILREGEVEIPAEARDVLLERLDGLDPTARHLVDLTALTTGRAYHDVLVAASGATDEEVTGVVEQLVAAALFVEDSSNGDIAYRLPHPLFYEVSRGASTDAARRRGHYALACGFERSRPDDVEELAFHYLGAGRLAEGGQVDAVLDEAAERAARRAAHRDACALLQAAVERSRRRGDARVLPSLLERLGDAHHAAGETGRALRAWTEALDEQGQEGMADVRARLQMRLGMASIDLGHPDVAIAHLEAAVAELEAAGPSPAMGDVLYTLVHMLRRTGRTADLPAAADRLERLADQLGTPRARAQAWYARAVAEADTGMLQEALEDAAVGLEVASAAGEDPVAYRLHTVACDAYMLLGDHGQMLEHGRAGRALADRLGISILAGGAAHSVVMAEILSGDWVAAEAHSTADLAMALRYDNPRFLITAMALRIWLLSWTGGWAEAAQLVSEANERFPAAFKDDRRAYGVFHMAASYLALERGEPEEVIERLEGRTGWGSFEAVAVFPLAEAQARLGRPDTAMQTVQVARQLSSAYLAAMVDRIEGIAYLLKGEQPAAAARFQAAVAGFDQLQMPYYAAQARIGLASALAGLNRDGAVAAAREAMAGFERLGARPGAEQAHALLHRLGVRRQARRQRTGLLSDRELEVARLAAAGLSNAAIAEQLTISIRTVTSHLDHVYTRLGVRGRAALVGYLEESAPAR